MPYAWLDGFYPGEHSAQDYEDLAAQIAANGAMTVWQAYVADLDPTDVDAVFQMDGVRSAAGAEITVDAASNRAYQIEFLDGTLADNPQIWNPFQANGAWTNVEPYTNRHRFVDTGAATNSGSPVTTQRNYRIWVGLP